MSQNIENPGMLGADLIRRCITLAVLCLVLAVHTATAQDSTSTNTADESAPAAPQRYRLTPDERLAVNEAARQVWDGTRIERVTARSFGMGSEPEPTVMARVEFVAHAGDDQVAEFYITNCTFVFSASGHWACDETETWRYLTVGNNADSIQVSPGVDIPGAFEVARFVRQLHLLEKDALTDDALVDGAITADQVRDQVMIELEDSTYRVSLKGLPLKHNFVIIGRKSCGRFATCGLEFLSAGASMYTTLPPTKRSVVRPPY